MDTKDAGRKGGLKRIANSTPEKVREQASKAGKASAVARAAKKQEENAI